MMKKDVLKVINKVILAEKTVNIKLLGDSITHGEGGTGFKQNGEPIVDGFCRNKDGSFSVPIYVFLNDKSDFAVVPTVDF